MDRTIKFRAWDTKLQRWNLSVEIDCFGNIQEYKYNGSAFYQKYYSDYECSTDLEEGNKRFILVQFTGLYDCEGKEVFEGDILEVTSNNDGQKYITTFKVNLINGLYIDNLSLCMDMCLYDYGITSSNCKVIGNLYEHPNLLNNE